MTVIITNETPERGDDEQCLYSIGVNHSNNKLIATFKHVPANGLAELMRLAADAVAGQHNEKG